MSNPALMPPTEADDTRQPMSAASWDTLRRGIWIIALKELGDAEQADEVAQETLARLITAQSRDGNPVRDPAAFARGVARHVILDMRAQSRRLSTLDSVENSLSHSTKDDPLWRAVAAEQFARVRAALARLSRSDRELLMALYGSDVKPGALARATGEPSERIRKRKSRALERLRQAFFGHESGSPATGIVDKEKP